MNRLSSSFRSPSNRDVEGAMLSVEEEAELRCNCWGRVKFSLLYAGMLAVGAVAGVIWMRSHVPELIPVVGIAMGPFGWLQRLPLPGVLVAPLLAVWLCSYVGIWIFGVLQGKRSVMMLALCVLGVLLALHFTGCQQASEKVEDRSEVEDLSV